MNNMKNVCGTIAVLLVFVGYIPYFRDILKGKTVPHIYSWFLWGFVTAIVFALQIGDNAGVGAYVTLAVTFMCGGVILLSLLKKNKRDITFSDTIFLFLGFISLCMWLFAKQPLISAILATITDLLGFVPTIRKSWHQPFSETLSLYGLNTLRFGLAIIALEHYSVITALYPISWLFANGLFALMLLLQRKRTGIFSPISL